MNFENLNLISQNIHQNKNMNDVNGVNTPFIASTTPKTDRKGNDTSCNASMIQSMGRVQSPDQTFVMSLEEL